MSCVFGCFSPVRCRCCMLSLSTILPVGSYPTPFLGYLLFYIADPDHKIRIRYPRKGVGYEPLGSFDDGSRSFPIKSLAYRTSGPVRVADGTRFRLQGSQSSGLSAFVAHAVPIRSS